MDERGLFDRFHEALELEPRPGAYERFRYAFTRPVAAKRRPVFRLRFSKMGLRIAAAVAVVLIAVALVAGYVALHHAQTTYVPGGSSPRSIADYKALMDADRIAMSQTSFSCGSLADPACPQDIAAVISVSLKWDADLAAFQTPAQFAVVDAQLRQHLALNRFELNKALTARSAGDATLFRDAVNYASAASNYVSHVAGAIVGSRSATAAQYKALAAADRQNLDSCSSCQNLVLKSGFSCASIQDAGCEPGVYDADGQNETIQADFVTNAAPTSLTDQDARLQSDLTNADAALLNMEAALVARDQTGLAAGRAAYAVAVTAIRADLTAIAGA